MEATQPRTDFVITSEYDIIGKDGELVNVDWDNIPEDLKNAATAMLTIGNAFRNWKASRQGGQFSQASICWLPSVESKQGHRTSVIAKLTAEFSSKENAFLAEDNDDAATAGELLSHLHQAVQKMTYYLGVAVGISLSFEGYAELTLSSTHDNTEQLIAAGIHLANIVSNDTVLVQNHEVIS